MQKKKILIAVTLVLVIVSVALAVIQIKHHRKEEKKRRKKAEEIPLTLGEYDSRGRLISYPNKLEIPCPAQTSNTAVILAIGQSNSANHAEKRNRNYYRNKAINYFDGKCFSASSPLLGASGEEGEYISMIADKLVASKTYEQVVIIAAGIGGSPISRWQRYGDLNEELVAILKEASKQFTVTHILWHQGERDFGDNTTKRVYADSFKSMLETIKPFTNAPVFMAVSTKCGEKTPWWPDNTVAETQRDLVDNRTVYLGADIDTLMSLADRRGDFCHLSTSGQEKAANAFFYSIRTFAETQDHSAGGL